MMCTMMLRWLTLYVTTILRKPVQESIEGRLSDAGLGASLDKLDIHGNSRNSSMDTITRQYESHNDSSDLDHQDTITGDSINFTELSKMISEEEYCDAYCDSLEIYCEKRISSTTQALEQVANLMLKIENCENLFPSRRLLKEKHDTWGEEEFKMRFLCIL